jgi:hypothetical protein
MGTSINIHKEVVMFLLYVPEVPTLSTDGQERDLKILVLSVSFKSVKDKKNAPRLGRMKTFFPSFFLLHVVQTGSAAEA